MFPVGENWSIWILEMLGTKDRPTKRNAENVSTAAAKQMFMYGCGDGVRVLEISELVKLSGVSRTTLGKHMPKWQAEFEETLRNTTKLASPNILSLPNETLEKHKVQTEFILARMEEVMAEIEGLGPIISNLERIVDQIAQISEDSDKVISLFDRYLRLCMNRKSLIKLFTDLKRLWDEKVGLDSLKAIQEATGKAASVAALKAGDPSPQNPEGIQVVANGVFRRRD